MGKFFKGIFTYAALPALLLGHWYTKHAAFLYLIGVMSVITLVVMLLGLASIVILFVGDEYATELPNVPAWKLAVGWVYQVTAITYLLYVEAFVVSTIYIISLIALNLMLAGMKAYNKRRAARLAVGLSLR